MLALFSEHKHVWVIFNEFIKLSRWHPRLTTDLIVMPVSVEQLVEVTRRPGPGSRHGVTVGNHSTIPVNWGWHARLGRDVDGVLVNTAKKLLQEENPETKKCKEGFKKSDFYFAMNDRGFPAPYLYISFFRLAWWYADVTVCLFLEERGKWKKPLPLNIQIQCS